MRYNSEKDDIRWFENWQSSERLSYLETLRAMCKYYGTFCGRWHDNTFWHKTLRESYSLTERDAKDKVFDIENDAESSLDDWRQYQ